MVVDVFAVRCAESRACYLAKRLHKAISGAGTRDRCLIRIVVTRCDIDLADIKREYEKLYGKSLAADISVIFDGQIIPIESWNQLKSDQIILSYIICYIYISYILYY